MQPGDHAVIRERHRGTHKVCGGKRSLPRSLDEAIKLAAQASAVESTSVAKDRNNEAVSDVDGDAQVKLPLKIAPAAAIKPAIERRLRRNPGSERPDQPCGHIGALHPGAH